MRLEWDAVKNRSNLAKHGLDFADAESVFAVLASPSWMTASIMERNGLSLWVCLRDGW
jgi:uncharacterized DUF497 family protein